MRPTDIFSHRTYKARQSASPYAIKTAGQRPSNGLSSSRQSRDYGQKKVYALPLTERELNYMQRNKSPNDASGTLRPVRNSAKLSSRENRMSEKPTIQKELNNSIGKPVADRYGAFTDRYGHRRTRTIGEPLERRDWGGLGSARERSGSRNGERSGIQTDRVGNLTSRDGSSSKLYRDPVRGNSAVRRSYGDSLTDRSGKEKFSIDLQKAGLTDRTQRPSARERQVSPRESQRGAMTDRLGSRDLYGHGNQSSRSANRGLSSQRDQVHDRNDPIQISRPETDRRVNVGSKSYGNEELRDIIKQREAEKNEQILSARRRSLEAERGNSNNVRRDPYADYNRKPVASGAQTDRGPRSTSNNDPRTEVRPKSRNSQTGAPNVPSGTMTERSHNRTYSDVITGKARSLPKFEQTKIILKKFGKVKGFGVNTHKGCVRNYNEDRVSILLNAQQRFKKIVDAGYKNCCLFGIYDGHGGSQCCNFLKEYLFSYILNEEGFTSNTIETLKKSFRAVDNQFVEKIQKIHPLDCSGSCAIVLLILDDMLYFMNVGDSRAILSQKGGRRVIQCSKDHKPSRESESMRIFQNEGIIYRVANIKGKNEPQMITARNSMELSKLKLLEQEDCVLYAGPFRVKPGGLSVSRTFGDIEAKKEVYGGRNGVVVADPEISTHCIEADDDFVLLASDGVFDTVSNESIVQIVYDTVSYYKQRSLDPYKEYEQILGACVSNVMKTSLVQQSEDNVTVMIVCFKNLLDLV